MTAHPPSDPAAEAEIALREDVAKSLALSEFTLRSPSAAYAWEGIDFHLRGKVLADADALIAGPLAPLLADIASLRAELVESRADAEITACLAGKLEGELAKARAEVARLTAALTEIAEQCPATTEMTLAHMMADTAVQALKPEGKIHDAA